MSGYGQQDPFNSGSEFNAIEFIIRQLLGTVRTTIVAQVMGVTNAGSVSPVGFVDVKPLVNQVDGAGNAVPHETIFSLPYFRLQGGGNAIILDPQVGDVGIAVIADRDISAVKASKAAANPGSSRRFDLADGIYIGGILNGTPNQYVEFSADGIRIHSPTQVKLDAPDVLIECETLEVNATTSVTVTTPTFTVNGDTALNGNLTQGEGTGGGTAHLKGPVTVDQDLTANGTSVHTHVHGGVQTGSGNTGQPV
jgi:hypothetical protein